MRWILACSLSALVGAQSPAPKAPLAGKPRVFGTPMRMHDNDVGAVALARDGRLVASAGWDGQVFVWDATTGKRVAAAKTDKLLTELAEARVNTKAA